jgi:Txe/YoeB family toxin of Txe-Axe toxin-antitoxin module
MEIKKKVDELLDKTEIDDKIKEKAGAAKEKVNELLDKTDVDDKIKAKAGELQGKGRGKGSRRTDLTVFSRK